MNEYKDAEQRAKVVDALKKYNEHPTSENLAKFFTELTKLGIAWDNNSNEEKEAAKDWLDLGYELFVSKDYDRSRAIASKLLSDINDLSMNKKS